MCGGAELADICHTSVKLSGNQCTCGNRRGQGPMMKKSINAVKNHSQWYWALHQRQNLLTASIKVFSAIPLENNMAVIICR